MQPACRVTSCWVCSLGPDCPSGQQGQGERLPGQPGPGEAVGEPRYPRSPKGSTGHLGKQGFTLRARFLPCRKMNPKCKLEESHFNLR